MIQVLFKTKLSRNLLPSIMILHGFNIYLPLCFLKKCTIENMMNEYLIISP